MAKSYTLEALPRTVTGKKVGALRRAGVIPCIIYGSKTEPVAIQVPARSLTTTLSQAGGTHLIDVSVQGTPYMVLARSVQRDMIRGDILHVDFLAVDAAEKIKAQVPVHFINESPAVKSGAGILLQGVNTLTIESLPGDLIDAVEVDLSVLNQIGDTVFVRDIKVSDAVALVDDPDDMIVRVVMTAAAESEEAAETEVTTSEPEVIGKGKKEEEVIED